MIRMSPFLILSARSSKRFCITGDSSALNRSALMMSSRTQIVTSFNITPPNKSALLTFRAPLRQRRKWRGEGWFSLSAYGSLLAFGVFWSEITIDAGRECVVMPAGPPGVKCTDVAGQFDFVESVKLDGGLTDILSGIGRSVEVVLDFTV